jgi:hypothetical protein
MRLAKSALVAALIMLTLCAVASAQTLKAEGDPRNTAPTVGTGGPMGGPTGLFTIYDSQTLRRGEFTFSFAYSNFDRDPGDADFTEMPFSFQIGLNDRWELFFNTDAYRGIKTNSSANLSGFYLPNSQLVIGGALRSPAAIVLAPRGPNSTGSIGLIGIFRPQGNQPFVQFPFAGGSAGTFGLLPGNPNGVGPLFGYPAGLPQLGIFRSAGGGTWSNADLFPGVGSAFGGILPGIVWTFTPLFCPAGTNPTTPNCGTAPVSFSVHPSYLPDAPFLNRRYGNSAFSTFTVGAKWRLNDVNKSYGFALIPFYRFYADKADDFSGFNQLQRGASPGGNFGDIGLVFAADARLSRSVNLSANVGYILNSNPKGQFPNGEFVLLDRPDELLSGIGFDFPINKYFQAIAELRSTVYMGGRTPNALENDPVDVLGGIRIFPRRWFGFSVAYRYHLNQQDDGSFDGPTRTITIADAARDAQGRPIPGTFTQLQNGRPVGLRTSDDPHGFLVQFWAGRRNARKPDVLPNNAPVVNMSSTANKIIRPCPPGQKPKSGAGCPESTSVQLSANATDPDGDTLLYSYTVTGGKIVGDGANVTWDMSGMGAGTYTVTVEVNDGCGCVTTQTKEITIEDCPCETPCATPSVSGPSTVKEGQNITFTSSLSDPSVSVTYSWSISAGQIVEDNGSSITVSTAGLGGQTVTATVKVSGQAPECPSTASASTDVERVDITKPPVTKDEFISTNFNLDKEQLDQFAAKLQAEPGSKGVIIYYTGTKTKRGEADARAIRVRNYMITTRSISPDRISVVVADGDGTHEKMKSQLWFVPVGADDTVIPQGREPVAPAKGKRSRRGDEDDE